MEDPCLVTSILDDLSGAADARVVAPYIVIETTCLSEAT
jgi:hypothetical protein